MFIIFWDFLIVEEIFLSPQVKGKVIIIVINWYTWVALRVAEQIKISPSQNENFVSTSKNLLKYKNWIFTVAPYFTWKLKFVSNDLWMIVRFWKQTRFVMLVLVFIYSLHILISFIDFPCISILPFIYHLRLLVNCILSKTIILLEMCSSKSLGYHNFSIT